MELGLELEDWLLMLLLRLLFCKAVIL